MKGQAWYRIRKSTETRPVRVCSQLRHPRITLPPGAQLTSQFLVPYVEKGVAIAVLTSHLVLTVSVDGRKTINRKFPWCSRSLRDPQADDLKCGGNLAGRSHELLLHHTQSGLVSNIPNTLPRLHSLPSLKAPVIQSSFPSRRQAPKPQRLIFECEHLATGTSRGTFNF